MEAILRCNDLATREDDVFDFLWEFLEAHDGDSERLWRSCRLAFVSFPRLCRLRKVLSTETACAEARTALSDAFAYRVALDQAPSLSRDLIQSLERSYPQGWLRPRRPPHVPPPSKKEVDFVVHIPAEPWTFWDRGEFCRSAPKEIDGARVSILVFPNGVHHLQTEVHVVSIYVEVTPAQEQPHDWTLTRRFCISVHTWELDGSSAALSRLKDGHAAMHRAEQRSSIEGGTVDVQSGALCLVDTFTFTANHSDRGWKYFPTSEIRRCCEPGGFLWLRAKVVLRSFREI